MGWKEGENMAFFRHKAYWSRSGFSIARRIGGG